MNTHGQVRAKLPGAPLLAIEALYRSRLPEFRRAAAAITGDRELACDAVQDAFAQAVRLRSTFRSDGSLEGWIWRIVVNTALSQTRARKPTTLLADVASTPAAAAPTRRPHESAARWRCCRSASV
jgi:DNA-directed RNA polymerase specialized sigma24 family protein